jgi:thymidylate synthase
MTKNYQNNCPQFVDESNLSRAWAKAMLYVMDHSGKEILPLILSVTGFDENGIAAEDTAVRQALDELLIKKGEQNVETVAYTIFPQRLWKMSKGNRAQLFRMYLDAFPRYQAMNRNNRYGLYFERLINYRKGETSNQLEWILSHNNKGVRRSMYQASVFDPERDHRSDPYLPFPCLHTLSFVPTKEGLIVNAFYATQKLFVKAYGNYLGIAQLGAFMAHEMGLKLLRLNVMVGVAKFDEYPKNDPDFEPLIIATRACVGQKSTIEALEADSNRLIFGIGT